jgi:hypothetical protein
MYVLQLLTSRTKIYAVPGYVLLFTATILSNCIEHYEPNIKGENGSKVVVSGEVINQPGYQMVSVSQASSIEKPEFIPLSGCIIEILDDLGNIFPLEEYEKGRYRVWIGEEMLQPGKAYCLSIITPSGDMITSAYDTMPECPEVDSFYYEREELPTNDPDKNIRGVQFYVDLARNDQDSRFYRWNLEETWEYHAQYPVEYYYDGKVNRVFPPDYTNKVCWSTEPVKSFFVLSMKDLTSNQYKRISLHFIDNTTTKLYIGYSVMLYQHAISESAFNFWEQLEINSVEHGNLYEKQPLPVVGNLTNLTYPDEDVLGFFGASSVNTKRIFIEGIKDMGIYYDSLCHPTPLRRKWNEEYEPSNYPVNFYYDGYRIMVIDPMCVNCTLLGGTIEKPEFWPW